MEKYKKYRIARYWSTALKRYIYYVEGLYNGLLWTSWRKIEHSACYDIQECRNLIGQMQEVKEGVVEYS